jgi:glycosyltransferase involved in cell wall biosynthesis
MKVSVIIRNRNEEAHIGYCLQSIIDFIGTDVQIVLVDNDSSDGSIRVANTFDCINIDKIRISMNDYSPGKALNVGIKQCTGDMILIISAHCEIIKFDMDTVISGLKSHIAIWGKQIPIWDGKKISRRYMWSNFKDHSCENYYCKFEDRYFFHNAFSIFMKKSLIDFPFDEGVSGKEDRFWVNERIEDGSSVKYESDLIVKHHYTVNGATWKGTG